MHAHFTMAIIHDGIDIIDKIIVEGTNSYKYILVAIDYFTK